MRPLAPLALILLPATAFANCSADMRVCSIALAGSDVIFTQPCSFTQCASVDTVFDYFRFADGSYVRVDHTQTQSLFQSRLAFVPAGTGPDAADGIEVTIPDIADDQRAFAAASLGVFSTAPCDASCDGLNADGFGD